MHFNPNFEIFFQSFFFFFFFFFFLLSHFAFELLCVNKNCSEHCGVLGEIVSIFKFSVLTENGNFHFFLKSFLHLFVSLRKLAHTIYREFFQP